MEQDGNVIYGCPLGTADSGWILLSVYPVVVEYTTPRSSSYYKGDY